MMDFTGIGLCYHPTTTLLIDDDKDFLTVLSTQLFNKDNIACQTFDNPIEALKYLNEDYQPDFFIQHCLESAKEDPISNIATVSLNLSNVHKQIYNPQRFTQIVDVIVDFDMPKLSGGEFCQQLASPIIQKIMLTGKAGQDTAVNLFNQQKINQFIMKSGSIELITQIPKIIYHMRYKTFISLSAQALNIANKIMSKSLIACLTDNIFIKLFNEIYHKAQAVEYYILDTQGSFLFVDRYGKLAWLIVVSEAEMQNYAQIAERGDGTPSVIQVLKNRTHIPFFPEVARQQPTSEIGLKCSPSEWNKYLHPAHILDSKSRYYYAYITDLKTSDIKFDQIVSYQSYLDIFYQKQFGNM